MCDAASSSTKVPCLLGDAVANPAAGVGEVKNAYDYAAKTYDFYNDVLGRDSIDDAGMTLISTVNYCPRNSSDTGDVCPYENAFWNGEQMVYGATYAGADDVVAHELTHGVTEKDNALFYYYQSGAINKFAQRHLRRVRRPHRRRRHRHRRCRVAHRGRTSRSGRSAT